jgi:hypothetical protein
MTLRTRLSSNHGGQRVSKVKIHRTGGTDPTVSPRVAIFALGRISIRLSQLQILFTVLPLLIFLPFSAVKRTCRSNNCIKASQVTTQHMGHCVGESRAALFIKDKLVLEGWLMHIKHLCENHGVPVESVPCNIPNHAITCSL